MRFSGLPHYILSPENIFIGYAFTTKELAFPKIIRLGSFRARQN